MGVGPRARSITGLIGMCFMLSDFLSFSIMEGGVFSLSCFSPPLLYRGRSGMEWEILRCADVCMNRLNVYLAEDGTVRHVDFK